MDKMLMHPVYLPSIEWYVVSLMAKELVFEQHDNYQKQTYRNRTYIYGANGKLILNIPVQHGRTMKNKKYTDVTPNNVDGWLRTHWKSLQSAYRTSPYFEYYEDDLEPVFQTVPTSLFDFNISLINMLDGLLGIERTYSFTNEYEKKTQDILDKRELVDSKRALSIPITRYYQVFQEKYGFIPNLSILDLLFNLGPESLSYLNNLRHDS